MTIYLSTAHRGGVGKTFIAVHVAGILSYYGERVLVIDCDTQGDSFTFFLGKSPENYEIQYVTNSLSVIWNPDREPIANKFDINEFDSVIIDIDSPLDNTVEIILNSRYPIDVILTPVRDFSYMLERLETTIDAFSELRNKGLNNGNNPIIKVIPNHFPKHRIKGFFDYKEYYRLNIDITIENKLRNLGNSARDCMANSKFIWEIEEHEDLINLFYSYT